MWRYAQCTEAKLAIYSEKFYENINSAEPNTSSDILVGISLEWPIGKKANLLTAASFPIIEIIAGVFFANEV